jgi:hypothetical protein
MHLDYAFKLSRMSVLVSGLQKFGIITILVSSCSLALAQATAPESTAQGRSPADADDQQLGRVTVTGYIVPRIGEGPVINVGNVASDPRYLSALFVPFCGYSFAHHGLASEQRSRKGSLSAFCELAGDLLTQR